MATSSIHYIGELRSKAMHLRSGDSFITDAPVDNQGKGEAFSPTDLLATSLGACANTAVGIAAKTHGFSVDGIEVSLTKIMENNPRRVGEIQIVFNFPKILYTEK